MGTKKYEIELSDEIAKHYGSSKREVEQRLYEEAILRLISSGEIDVYQGAKLLNCDPDELLTPEEEADLLEAQREYERGEYISLDELRQKHGF